MRVKVKRALLSVWDKAGLVELAQGLHTMGVELVSSGNTSATLEAAGIPVTRVEAGHRFAGNARRTREDAASEDSRRSARRSRQRVAPPRPRTARHPSVRARRVELYPFESSPDIETIDIGGPAMTRAAAKNHEWVTIVTDPAQYGVLLEELHAQRRHGRRRVAPLVRARSLRAYRGVRRRDRCVAAAGRAVARSTSSSRSTAPTRRCATARTRTSRARATAATAPRAGGTA